MLNFTSALYLGLYHPMHTLRPWRQFTTGAPATLTQPSIASHIAKPLAALQCLKSATLGPSTFHLFWDLFGILTQKRIIIHLDDDAYPIAKWGIESASAASVSVNTFKLHNADRLSKQIHRTKGKRPVIVTDGYVPCADKLHRWPTIRPS
jgi:8-amino-7-oxononanoate synthase